MREQPAQQLRRTAKTSSTTTPKGPARLAVDTTGQGILSRRTLELLLTKVESIGVEEEILGRMLGYGTVVVRGTGGTPEPFKNIAQPMEFRRQVQQQIEHRTPEKVSA